jgi:hypothetical protein
MIIEWSIVENLFNMMTNNGIIKKSKHTWIWLCQLYGFSWFLKKIININNLTWTLTQWLDNISISSPSSSILYSCGPKIGG